MPKKFLKYEGSEMVKGLEIVGLWNEKKMTAEKVGLAGNTYQYYF